MGEDPQAAERHRRGLPPGLDPRTYDPRRAVDPAQMERVMHAQAVARAQAQAATTVTIATLVSLVTSAFSFVAALAWNDAIHQVLQQNVSGVLKGLQQPWLDIAYAAVVTLIAVIVVTITNRVATRIARKSAIDATAAGQGSL